MKIKLENRWFNSLRSLISRLFAIVLRIQNAVTLREFNKNLILTSYIVDQVTLEQCELCFVRFECDLATSELVNPNLNCEIIPSSRPYSSPFLCINIHLSRCLTAVPIKFTQV